jgi:hypothetical protein
MVKGSGFSFGLRVTGGLGSVDLVSRFTSQGRGGDIGDMGSGFKDKDLRFRVQTLGRMVQG